MTYHVHAFSDILGLDDLTAAIEAHIADLDNPHDTSLDKLIDVDITGAEHRNSLTYNSGTLLWGPDKRSETFFQLNAPLADESTAGDLWSYLTRHDIRRSMNEVQAQKGTFKGYGLVRNAKGEPQFDDYENINEAFHSILTEEDWIYINEKRKEPCQ